MSDTTPGAPVNLPETETRPSDDTTGGIRTRRTELAQRRVPRGLTRGANALAPVISIDRLYDAPAGSESQMVRALELLAETIQLLDQARLEIEGDAITSERLVQRVQTLLDHLFSYRRIGDGFGLVVNSFHFAFINLQGKPLTSEQLNTVWRVLKELRTRPALSFDQGLQYVTELEEKGFEVDPSVLGELLESTGDDKSVR